MRICFLCILCFWTSCLLAQENSIRLTSDSLPFVRTQKELLSSPSSHKFSHEETIKNLPFQTQKTQSPKFHLQLPPFMLPYYTDPSPMHRNDYVTEGKMGTYFYGSGSQYTLPGIGLFNEASLNFRYEFKAPFSFEAGIDALKINMPFGVGQAFRASGAVLYHPSEQWTLKAFGSYSPGNAYGMFAPSYGGTFTYHSADRFSLEMGVERHYTPLRKKWETVPVVIPSYKFDKFELGLDVGGILYEILRNTVFKPQNSGSPTIAPPKFQFGK